MLGDTNATQLAQEAVAGLSKSDTRVALVVVRQAHVSHPRSFWDRLIVHIGMTVGEFCAGYSLNRKTTSR